MVNKKKSSSTGRIDRMERLNWLLFTLIYAIFVAILGGIVQVYLPRIVYIWNVPLDIQQGVWVFGLALWGVISILLNMHYKAT